jgi:predicted dehydrogenase
MALRIGVIGTGYGSTVHIPSFQSEGLDVVAICASHQENAEAAAKRFGVPHTFTDYRDLLAHDGLDAVSVASPARLHYPMVVDAIQAGKHVICEKPFTTSIEDALMLWQTAESSGLTCMLAHEFRFSSGRAFIHERLEAGYIGPLHHVVMSLVTGSRAGRGEGQAFTNSDSAQQGGGLLWSQGSHYIDCLRHWFGDIRSVSGTVHTHMGQRANPETGQVIEATADNAFSATLEFANGGWAALTFSNIAGFGPGGRIEIYGRDGTLVTPQASDTSNPPAHGIVLGAKVGTDALAPLPIPNRLQPFIDERDERIMPMRLLIREFLRGIQEGVSPTPNFHDGYRVMQILGAIRQSSATGSTVHIDLAR